MQFLRFAHGFRQRVSKRNIMKIFNKAHGGCALRMALTLTHGRPEGLILL